MEISTEKSKIMAFCGKDPVPSKICLDKKILERVNQLSYLGYRFSFLEELDISDKIIKYNKSVGIINNIIIIIIISVLPKGRSFTANSGTKAEILPKGWSSTANSGT